VAKGKRLAYSVQRLERTAHSVSAGEVKRLHEVTERI